MRRTSCQWVPRVERGLCSPARNLPTQPPEARAWPPRVRWPSCLATFSLAATLSFCMLLQRRPELGGHGSRRSPHRVAAMCRSENPINCCAAVRPLRPVNGSHCVQPWVWYTRGLGGKPWPFMPWCFVPVHQLGPRGGGLYIGDGRDSPPAPPKTLRFLSGKPRFCTKKTFELVESGGLNRLLTPTKADKYRKNRSGGEPRPIGDGRDSPPPPQKRCVFCRESRVFARKP